MFSSSVVDVDVVNAMLGFVLLFGVAVVVIVV